jgi:hypothetical protein
VKSLHVVLVGANLAHAGVATVTTKLHCARLPHPSTAVQVTVVLPTGNALPEGGVHVTVTDAGQLSLAVGGR